MYILAPRPLYYQHCPLEINADDNHKSGQFSVVLIIAVDSSGHAPILKQFPRNEGGNFSPKRRKKFDAFFLEKKNISLLCERAFSNIASLCEVDCLSSYGFLAIY